MTPDYVYRSYPDNTPSPESREIHTAYTLTCDAGMCSRPTVAVIFSIEGMWLSMCLPHAMAELEQLA